MPETRGTLVRAANRGAMLASIFVAGAVLGWVASERDLVPRPPEPPTPPLLRAEGAVPEADDSMLVTPPGVAPAPSVSTESAADAPAGGLGPVAVGPPALDDSGRATPLPSRAELEALRRELVVPVAGVERADLRDTFDERRGGGTRAHHALDVPAPQGTRVVSAAAGRLVKLFSSEDGGLMVYATDPSERFVLLYGHLDGYAEGLREGMPLRRGQPLGVVGTTGNAPDGVPHLHFGILRTDSPDRWWQGTPVDPHALLAP